MNKVSLLIAGACLLGVAISANQAEARPNYLKAFTAEYPNVTAAKDVKCGVCHPEKSKKVRNDYGKAVGGALGAKKVKDAEKLKEAFAASAKKPSKTEGKTFGDLLKEGKLPDPK